MKKLRVPTLADRHPGQPWRPGTPRPAPIDPDLPSADIRIGYARCSHRSQELDSQLDALTQHGIPRDKIFSEKIGTRIRVRPAFEQALKTAREIKAHAPHCRVIFTVFEMKRLGRDAVELTALADHLTAHDLVLEMLHGPLTGIYDPSGAGRPPFAFFAAMAETEREDIRESTVEGLDTAARKGKHGGRPPVITDDMSGVVSGPHWSMPNGMSGPGKVSTLPLVPISGLTSDAGSPTRSGAADTAPTATAWTGRMVRARPDTKAIRLWNSRQNLAMACLRGDRLGIFTGDVRVVRRNGMP